MGRRWRSVAWPLALLLAGCGDPMVGKEFRGDPLFTLEGRVMSYESGGEDESEFRVSLFWSPSGETRVPVDDLVEQLSASVRVQFPSTFEINIFYPPESLHLVGVEPDYGMALVLVYEDRDGNGRFTPGADPSELVGGAVDHALLFATRALGREQSPTGMAVPRGFSVVDIPVDCYMRYLPDQGDQPCGYEVGNSCDHDGDCGEGGICLRTWTGGYCTLPVTEDGCAPLYGSAAAMGELYWMQACERDADCTREGYLCIDFDPGLDRACRVCWPQGVPPSALTTCTISQSPYADPVCSETLGAACEEDADCATDLDAGRCLQGLGDAGLAGGYCTLADPYYGCYPADGRYLTAYKYYWFRQCAADVDCRTEEGYACDSVFRICAEQTPVQLRIHRDFRSEAHVESLCLD